MFPPVLAIGFIEVVIILIVVGFTIANWIRKAMQAMNNAKSHHGGAPARGNELANAQTSENATDLEAMAARRREQLRLASGGSKARPQRRADGAGMSATQRAQREAEQRRVDKMRGTEDMAAAARERAAQAQRAAEAARARAKQIERAEREAKEREDRARRERAKAELEASVAGLDVHPTHETPASAPQAQPTRVTKASAAAVTPPPSGRAAAPGIALLRGMSLRDAIVVREILDPPLSTRPAQQRQ